MLRTLGGVRVDGSEFARPKPLLLLVYLTLEGPQLRNHLAELFWPNSDQARRSLTTALGRLRRACPGVVVADQLWVRSELTSDVAELRGALREGELARALTLYRGPFLEGIDLPVWPVELEEWVYAQREAVAEELRLALLRDARREAKQGRFEAAARVAARAFQLAGAAPPAPEESIRIHALLRAGDHPLAVTLASEVAGYGLPVPSSAAEARALLDADRSDDVPHRLPHRGGCFVGRQVELAELSRVLALPDRRLLTLVGPGGMGKTRLALEAAHQALGAGAFQHGVFFVDLAAVRNSHAVAGAIAEVLGLDLPAGADPLARLAEHLRGKQVLLVLDNVEQLAGIGGQVEVLLEECAHLTLLVTSRHRLGLGAEWVMAVTGLSYPDDALDVEEATLFDAPALFLRRARQVRGAAVASDELPHVLRLCRLLDGAPLGLELAAGWTHLLSCRELVGEVERTFDVLAREGTSSDDRHGSLRGVFAHSWSLLSAGEGRALARLAVFRGGFTREAALAVAGCDLATLASLARKSLVQRVEEGRFRLLEVTREYAGHQLAADPEEWRAARARHTAFVLDLAERGEPGLRGDQQVAWVARLTAERDNIRTALDRCREASEVEAGLRIVSALQMFWWLRGAYREGLERTRELLAQSGDGVRPDVRAKALHRAGTLAQELGEYAEARRAYHEALELAAAHADVQLQADALHSLGLLASKCGDTAEAVGYYERCLVLQRRIGDRWGVSATLNNLGVNAIYAGKYAEARPALLESLEHKRAMGEQQGIAYALHNLGTVAYGLGEYETAREYALESLSLKREIGDEQGMATSHHSLGRIALRRGEFAVARAELIKCLSLMEAVENRWAFAVALPAAAELEARVGRSEVALRLVGGVDALCAALGARLPRLSADELGVARRLASRGAEPPRVEGLLAEGRALAPRELVAILADVSAARDELPSPP